MNTIGKILVVLNFVFALVVGVILVFNIAFREPWKARYEELVRQTKVLEANLQSTVSTQGKIGEDYGAMAQKIETLKQQLKETEDAKQAFEAAKLIEITELKNKFLDKDLTTQEVVKTKERLVQEIDLLNKTIKDREVFINKIQDDTKVATATAQNFEQLAKARQLQNEALLENIQKLTRELAVLQTGANPDAVILRNPNAPNPPAAVVSGKIEKVDGTDGTLIQITLGTDNGVSKNNTLDVYRLTPEPKYLGMIRIVDAFHQKSIARFVYTGNASYRPQLRVDDVVTSKIGR